jgi:hypothetical protein
VVRSVIGAVPSSGGVVSAEVDDDVEDVVVSVTVPCAVLVVVVVVVVVVDIVIARRDVYVNVGLRFAFCGRGEELWWLVLSFPPLHASESAFGFGA